MSTFEYLAIAFSLMAVAVWLGFILGQAAVRPGDAS